MQPDSSVVLFPIAQIKVPADRQREKAEADATLLASIEQNGLINPILIHSDGRLVAGERRLDAHRKLKREYIRATVLENLPPLTAFKLELLENLARKQLSWQEEIKAIASYHKQRLDFFSGWTQRGTAGDLGISEATVSRALLIAAEIDDPEVIGCPTATGALNLITGRADRARTAAMSRGLAVSSEISQQLPPRIPEGATKAERTKILLKNMELGVALNESVDETGAMVRLVEEGRIAAAALEQQRKQEISSDLVICADFIEWVADYTGPKFDVLHIDFPYGIEYKGSGTRRTGKAHIAPAYLDTREVFFQLLEALLEHQDRVAFPAAHCLFWFDMRYYQPIRDAFDSAGWNAVSDWPLIWTKGYQGVASDPKRRPRHCYEAAMLFVRGDRKLSKLDRDWTEALVDEKLHMNQKPLAALKAFLGMIVDEHTAVLDPTCGSGAALAACLQLKAARFLGVELDSSNADVARFLVQRHLPEAAQEKK